MPPDEAAPAPAPAAAPPLPPAATPWHTGIDAEIIGHAQNKGWNLDDPKAAFSGAVKQARELERHFGVPPEQLLKLPKADAGPADLKAFWGKLGAADAKDYDLSSIKFSDGTELEASFVDTMRNALATAFVPKDKAATITSAVVKYLEDADKSENTLFVAKVAEEQTKLKTDWGANYEYNRLKAMEGARRLGITPDAIAALEKQIGYAAVMNAMRKIGVGTSEDNFVERGTGSNGNPTTREGSVARKADLMADSAWVERYLKGGMTEKREMTALNTMIDGDM